MIKILFAGDYCPTYRLQSEIENGAYRKIFNKVLPIVNSCDYSVVNLECPIVESGFCGIQKAGPVLGSPKNAIEAIKLAGFDLVTLANNHFYDYGLDGVINTLDRCLEFGVDTVGGGVDLKRAKEAKMIKLKDKLIAILNFCENEFSIAAVDKAGSNPLNPISNYYQILEAKKKADWVIVIVHGGHEHYQLPSCRMKETYRFFVDSGADVVVNHHQHCFSGYEVYNGRPIFYGLGNFLFDWIGKRDCNWNLGYLVELILDGLEINFQLHPYNQCSEEVGIELLDSTQLVEFQKKINELNQIIVNDDLLQAHESGYYSREGKNLLNLFEPFPTNRYLRSLRRRELIPSTLSQSAILEIRNIVECESHRDKILGYMKSTDKK